MRPSATWFLYGLGLIFLLLSVWLVLFPPGKGGKDSISSEQALQEQRAASDLNGLNHEASAVQRPSADPDESPPAVSILPAPQLPAAKLVAAERDAWIRKYCEQLAEYSYQKDMASLERLLTELGSAELKIAEAAYHNLMARHDRRAIPYLELKIAAASSAFEKKHLQELVDFLQTKSILDSDLSDKSGNR